MAANTILVKMLDRLYASLTHGPGLNCRPHSSRQRIDLTALLDFDDIPPRRVMADLLGPKHAASVGARVPMPAELVREHPFWNGPKHDEEAKDPPQVAAWRRQQSLLTKLRHLGEEAKTYEQDTGVHALHVGYPILSLPPGSAGGTKRILAPMAFIPVSLEVGLGRRSGIELACRAEGEERVDANAALMAWIERETGKSAEDLFADEEGADPWREIGELVDWVIAALDLPAAQKASLADAEQFTINAVPKAEDLGDQPRILASAVLGLFPVSNQGLLRDMRAMVQEPPAVGPVCSFIDVGAKLEEAKPAEPGAKRRIGEQRLVAPADPCQARTVALARTSTGLVVHGPPGTGKSQTITNIIGDHLSRDQRVLFVCEKRTALDVVANRLEHLGLGGLCAVVHDPQRDQRDLYLSIRGRLDELADRKVDERAEGHLAKVDAELQALHEELTVCHAALMKSPGDGGLSFHELMGQWLALDSGGVHVGNDAGLRSVSLASLDGIERDVQVILERARKVGYPTHPWRQCVGMSLDALLSRSMDQLRRQFSACVEDARAADVTRDDLVPPLDGSPLHEQAPMRLALAEQLEWIGVHASESVRARVAAMTPEEMRNLARQIVDARPHRETLAEGALDAELALAVRGEAVRMSDLNAMAVDLERYTEVSQRWYGFVMFGVRSAATAALKRFGLPRSPDNARRLSTFLRQLRARYVLTDLMSRLTGATMTMPASDEALAEIEAFAGTLNARLSATSSGCLATLFDAALMDAGAREKLVLGLQRSTPRAQALVRLETSMAGLGLFDPKWLAEAQAALRGGKRAAVRMLELEERLNDLESIVRVQHGLEMLPEVFRRAVKQLIDAGVGAEQGMVALRRGVLEGEIVRRMSTDHQLSRLDEQRLQTSFSRYAQLERQKMTLVTRSIVARWTKRQRERLLTGTGTRLSSQGADLRRRLFVRGHRAMRLRQVIAVGESIEGGDPLFDMCPVWMASPETVAQIFPRQAWFDVVIFDEASQCRLEEALPVLTRAKRVVVAGDPKQLPPTRFFESAVVSSDDDAIETEQDLFEVQQSDVEDLLSAALNLDVHESYLDVHYRSRNADLIEFSNHQFYGSRLQAIPGHPRHRMRYAPLRLDQVGGVYADRANEAEAKRVCQIVDELLRRAEPPSIGIACFNLTQRDLIADMLDEKAVENEAFGKRLAEARQRQGEGSFEGLFVKNLENVQGDERDHIIISTTYGPTPEGKFYRRFGPLGMAGGGRRLNVLVTRARHEVHLVTSIPPQVYRAAESVPEGMTPNGAWLLFAYLRYAEELEELYKREHAAAEQAQAAREPVVVERRIEPASVFAEVLARRLQQRCGIGSDVHWGNAGFCIDAALHHPRRAEDVTIGLLCDFTRYPSAADPVEWEIFRAGVLEWQGWKLHRVWSPQYFRDAQRVMGGIEQAAGEAEGLSGPKHAGL